MRLPDRRSPDNRVPTPPSTVAKFIGLHAIYGGLQAYAWVQYSRADARAVSLVASFGVAIAITLAAPALGMRRAFALIVGIPFLGAWPLWLFLWRISSLPNRYWRASLTPSRWQGWHIAASVAGGVFFIVEGLAALKSLGN